MTDDEADLGQCAAYTKTGKRCNRHIDPRETRCWQHAQGIRHKLRSLSRNQGLVFWLSVAGLLVSVSQWNALWFLLVPRAQVEIGTIEKVATAEEAAPIGVVFKYALFLKKSGSHIATDVSVRGVNFEVDESFYLSKRAIRTNQDQFFIESGTGKRVLMPELPAPQVLLSNNISAIPFYLGGMEPNNNGKIMRYSAMLGRIDYTDADTGIKHWKHFCYKVIDRSGTFHQCPYGNDED